MKSSCLSSEKRSRADENVDDAKKPPAKKSRKKKKRNLEAMDTSTELPLDALGLVMEFLSPRQLYNLAFSCKTLRGFITTQLVVKSALIHGGHSKQTLVELHHVMKNKAMHVPSALRLLRLVNGKRCEFCNKAAVNRTRSCFGVFGCWSCTTERGLTAPWKLTWVRYKRNQREYGAIFRHPRIAYSPYGNVHYMWAKHRRWKGEIIGPLAAHGDVDEMFEYTTKGHGTLDSYIDIYLLKESDTDEAYAEFNEAYSETWERSEQIAREREEKKAASKAKTKENKMAKIVKMCEDLKKMLDEPYRECALKYYELKYDFGAKGISKRPVVRFQFPLAEKLLVPFAITPSKIRKKILAEIAQELNENLRLVTTGFVTLDFLSPNDPCEVALKGYFIGKLTDVESFFEMVEKSQSGVAKTCYRPRGLIDEQFFNLLKAKQQVCALAYVLKRDLSCFFVDSVQHSHYERVLAKTVWFNSLEGMGDKDQHYRLAYATMATAWPKALLGFRGYMVWIDKEYTQDRDRNFKRPFVSEKACSRASLLPLLVDEKFEELDKIVSDGFERYIWDLMR